jgi:hypothetical protein
MYGLGMNHDLVVGKGDIANDIYNPNYLEGAVYSIKSRNTIKYSY